MKTIFLALLLSLFCSLPGNGQTLPAQAEGVLKNGEKAPALGLKDINGNTIGWEALKGKVVFVNFFFLRCPPCQFEIAMLQELAAHYREKDVVFVSISITDPAKELLSYKKEYEEGEYRDIKASASFQAKTQVEKDVFLPNKFDLTPRYGNQILIAGDELGPNDENGRERAKTWWLAQDFKIQSYPTNFIINQEGVIAISKDGYDFYKKKEEKKTYMEVIDGLLAK